MRFIKKNNNKKNQWWVIYQDLEGTAWLLNRIKKFPNKRRSANAKNFFFFFFSNLVILVVIFSGYWWIVGVTETSSIISRKKRGMNRTHKGLLKAGNLKSKKFPSPNNFVIIQVLNKRKKKLYTINWGKKKKKSEGKTDIN